jgi:hypothetical protein
VPGTFVLPAGPASPAAARARPQPPPRPRRAPRPRQCQVRRACREAGPPRMAELNCSGLGGPLGVPDRVRNTKLTYPVPPRISPRHAAPADGRRASRTHGGVPAGGWRQGPQAARPLAAGSIGGRQRYKMFHLAYPTQVLRRTRNRALGGYLCAHGRAHHALGGSAAPASAGLTSALRRAMAQACDRGCDQDGVRRTVPGETGGDPAGVSAHVKCDLPGQAERAETAIGLFITQRSRVQIPPPLLVSAGQGPFPMGEGLWRIRACDHDGGLVPSRR